MKGGITLRKRGFEKINLSKYQEFPSIMVPYDQLILPKRSTKNSAGYDFLCLVELVVLPHQTVVIPTGIKAYMQDDEVLYIYLRSSIGIKTSLRLANTTGVIDSDYYNNPNNEGHIMLAFTNIGEEPVKLSPGCRVVQGVFQKYLLTDDDSAPFVRLGGIGSTNNL